MGGQPSIELLPSLGVLTQELQPGFAPGVVGSYTFHALGQQTVADRLGIGEERLAIGGACASRGYDQRPAHARVGDAEVEHHAAPHGQAAQVRLLDAHVPQQLVQVFHGVILGVRFRVGGHVRWRVASGRVGDDLVPP